MGERKLLLRRGLAAFARKSDFYIPKVRSGSPESLSGEAENLLRKGLKNALCKLLFFRCSERRKI